MSDLPKCILYSALIRRCALSRMNMVKFFEKVYSTVLFDNERVIVKS